MNEKFDQWFNELEGYHLRSERIMDDCEVQDEIARKRLITWLREAFEAGMQCNDR